jgi:hypothetical protein
VYVFKFGTFLQHHSIGATSSHFNLRVSTLSILTTVNVSNPNVPVEVINVVNYSRKLRLVQLRLENFRRCSAKTWGNCRCRNRYGRSHRGYELHELDRICVARVQSTMRLEIRAAAAVPLRLIESALAGSNTMRTISEITRERLC